MKKFLSKVGSAVVHTDLRDMGIGIGKASVVVAKGTKSATLASGRGIAKVSVKSAEVVVHPVSTVQEFRSNRAEFKDFVESSKVEAEAPKAEVKIEDTTSPVVKKTVPAKKVAAAKKAAVQK